VKNLKNIIINSLSLPFLVGSIYSCADVQQKKDSVKPNIILILADDLGYGDVGCFGQKILATPNLDQMAKEGMRFTNHYTGSTVCAPSRASLMIGKHTGHTSVRGNQPEQLLLDSDITLADKMKEAGYISMAIGKWGIGHPPPPNDPQRNGFDHFYGYINMWHAHNFYPEFLYRDGEKEYLDNKLISKNGINPWSDMPEGTGVAEKKKDYVHNLFDKEALNFIEKNKDTCFFLYLAYNAPHANNEAGIIYNDGMEVPNYGEFENRDWPDPEKGFATMIRNLDNSVGLVNKKLHEFGIDRNTIVFFVSDNGPHEEGNHSADFFDSNSLLRGKKRDLYEGGIRSPFIAKWPGKISAGSTSRHVSAFWDFLPTICDIAGVETPGESDGISFLPTLIGKEKNQKSHPFLYFEFYEMGGKQSVLWENWKAVRLNVRTGNPSDIELYNLKLDPSEITNVANENPEMVAEMLKRMKDSHVEVPYMSLFSY
jgi:arylsulfatase A-like enzyme